MIAHDVRGNAGAGGSAVFPGEGSLCAPAADPSQLLLHPTPNSGGPHASFLVGEDLQQLLPPPRPQQHTDRVNVPKGRQVPGTDRKLGVIYLPKVGNHF